MKKIVIVIITLLLLAGCVENKKENIAKELLTTLISYDTYQEEKNEDNLPVAFKAYFSEDGYNKLVKEKTGYVYSEFFWLINAEATKNIQVKSIQKTKAGEEVKLECKVEYMIVYKNEKIKMKDQIVMNIDKKYQVTNLLILNTSDVIHKMFFGTRIL